jgi:hypothetical protein
VTTLSLQDPGFLSGLTALDPDAAAYITAVEAADGQSLETGVRTAINAFVVGCKADGIWSAIKAACILAGARTLNGALVPLVGSAPTNNNFASDGYDRKTGLKGNGSNKYLNTNRNNNADPQNNKHVSVYLTEAHSGVAGIHLGTNAAATAGTTQLASDTPAGSTNFSVNNTGVNAIATGTADTGLIGASRASSANFTAYRNGASSTASLTSNTPNNISTFIFCRNGTSVFSNARIAYYSIGESLNLALLNARVTALINAYAAAIP